MLTRFNRFLCLCVLVLTASVLLVAKLFAAEAVVPDPSTVEKVLSFIWSAMQTPVGVSVVVFALSYILGKVFTAKPTWEVYVNKYRPLIISAVKKAEKEIPDDTPNKGLARLDLALKYILALESKLDTTSLKQAITAVHSEVESTL